MSEIKDMLLDAIEKTDGKDIPSKSATISYKEGFEDGYNRAKFDHSELVKGILP